MHKTFILLHRYSKLYTEDTLQWFCKKADRVIHLHCEVQCTLAKEGGHSIRKGPETHTDTHTRAVMDEFLVLSEKITSEGFYFQFEVKE